MKNRMIDQNKEWKRIGQCMLAAALIVGLCTLLAYITPIERQLVAAIGKSGLDEFRPILRIRDQHDSYVPVIGILAVWIVSPLMIHSGYILIARILKNHILQHTSPENLTVLRTVGAVIFLVMTIYALVLLPGKSSAICRNCESNSQLFLLVVNGLGIFFLGAILGYIAIMISILFSKKGV